MLGKVEIAKKVNIIKSIVVLVAFLASELVYFINKGRCMLYNIYYETPGYTSQNSLLKGHMVARKVSHTSNPSDSGCSGRRIASLRLSLSNLARPWECISVVKHPEFNPQLN